MCFLSCCSIGREHTEGVLQVCSASPSTGLPMAIQRMPWTRPTGQQRRWRSAVRTLPMPRLSWRRNAKVWRKNGASGRKQWCGWRGPRHAASCLALPLGAQMGCTQCSPQITLRCLCASTPHFSSKHGSHPSYSVGAPSIPRCSCILRYDHRWWWLDSGGLRGPVKVGQQACSFAWGF